jgi:hypothetical protein
MELESDKDFPKLRQLMYTWRKNFPMFKHDVNKLEHTIESYIQEYSIALVHYRQTKQKRYVERAEQALRDIETVVNNAEKAMLMSLLSRR